MQRIVEQNLTVGPLEIDHHSGSIDVPVSPIDYSKLSSSAQHRLFRLSNSGRPTATARKAFGCANCLGAKFVNDQKTLEISPTVTFGENNDIESISLSAFCQVASLIVYLRKKFPTDSKLKQATLACQEKPKRTAIITIKG